jgi:DNA-binding transcriptional LysR family regulator
MDLDDLELFLKVLDSGSFTRTARSANLDPSVVSRRIAALEAHLGVRLLHRTTRAVSPTEAGRDWAERVRPSVRALRDAEQELRVGEHELSGTVRLAVPGALGRLRVAPLVFSLLARHPALRVDLLVSDARIGLVEESVDLAVRVGVPRDSGFVARRLGASPQVFVASPGYLACHPLPAEGSEMRVVMRLEGGPQGLEVFGRDWTVVLASDDVETVASAIEAGLGVGMLPEWLAAGALAAGRLVRLPSPVEVPPAPIVALLPGGLPAPRRVRAVLDALAEGFSEPR